MQGNMTWMRRCCMVALTNSIGRLERFIPRNMPTASTIKWTRELHCHCVMIHITDEQMIWPLLRALWYTPIWWSHSVSLPEWKYQLNYGVSIAAVDLPPSSSLWLCSNFTYHEHISRMLSINAFLYAFVPTDFLLLVIGKADQNYLFFVVVDTARLINLLVKIAQFDHRKTIIHTKAKTTECFSRSLLCPKKIEW